jgi:hypothetical protein
MSRRATGTIRRTRWMGIQASYEPLKISET